MDSRSRILFTLEDHFACNINHARKKLDPKDRLEVSGGCQICHELVSLYPGHLQKASCFSQVVVSYRISWSSIELVTTKDCNGSSDVSITPFTRGKCFNWGVDTRHMPRRVLRNDSIATEVTNIKQQLSRSRHRTITRTVPYRPHLPILALIIVNRLKNRSEDNGRVTCCTDTCKKHSFDSGTPSVVFENLVLCRCMEYRCWGSILISGETNCAVIDNAWTCCSYVEKDKKVYSSLNLPRTEWLFHGLRGCSKSRYTNLKK